MSKMTYDTRTMANPNGMGGEEPAVEFQTVKTPLPTDILCGKNKICIKHEGSKSFRRIIESYTQKYQDAGSRNEKMEVTKEIFDRLQSRRFLKYNEDTDMWETLHPLAVRDKIGHALRFSNRKGNTTIRKQVVRHSASDMAALQSGDIDTMRRTSMSMNCMDSMGLRKSHSKQALNKLRASTGNARPNRLPNSTSNQDILTALPSFRSLHIGSNIHKDIQDDNGNQNAVFPSRTGSSRVTPNNRFQTMANQDMLSGLPGLGNLDLSGMNQGNQNSVFPSRAPSSNNRLSGNKASVFQNAGQDMISDLSTLNSLAIANSIELKTINTSAPLNINNHSAAVPQSTPSAPSAPTTTSAAAASQTLSGDLPDDLSWMLQMPLMDMDGEGQVYFVNGQQQQQQQQQQEQPHLQQFSV